MPISGRKAKPEGQAVTRHKPTHDWTEVQEVPFVGGPDLPEYTANRRAWQPAVREMWESWRTMPHCTLWGPSDWSFALVSIELAALFYDGDARTATELRNREKVLGTTADFRRDLRIRYVKPKSEVNDSAAGVTNLAEYRDL
jgi:hypothetical protein